jgi:hypothetical protein
VSPHGPAVAALVASNGTIYWATHGYMMRSTDIGVTWTTIGSGLRAIRPVELPDQRLVTVGESTLMMSSDRGNTWLPFGPALPYRGDGLIYSPQRKAFFIWRSDCGNQVPGDAVMMLEFDPSPAAAPAK